MIAEKLYPNEIKPIFNGYINQEQRLQSYVRAGTVNTMSQGSGEVSFTIASGDIVWYYVVDDISKYNTLVAVGRSVGNPYSPPNGNCMNVALFEGDTPNGQAIDQQYFTTSDTTRTIDLSNLHGTYCIAIRALYSGGGVKQLYLE